MTTENSSAFGAPTSNPSTAIAELEAMRASHDALKDLPLEAKGRCINWLVATFGLAGQSSSPKVMTGNVQRAEPTVQAPASEAQYPDLPSLFAAARPEVQADKALVVAYWFQEVLKNDDLDSQNINSELKHLGHGVPNITRALENLIEARPALMIQTRKDGTSKQARKRYKVTTEGKNRVLALLASPNGGDNG